MRYELDDSVIYDGQGGYEYDVKAADLVLTRGTCYRVLKVKVEKYYTYIYLELSESRMDGPFNSCMFAKVSNLDRDMNALIQCCVDLIKAGQLDHCTLCTLLADEFLAPADHFPVWLSRIVEGVLNDHHSVLDDINYKKTC